MSNPSPRTHAAAMNLTVNNINISYQDHGEGPAVIFIHAFPLNQGMWDDQAGFLKTTCRVITLDLRGFGQSDVPATRYSLADMASDIRGLMRVLSIDQAVLVGLSMGGYVSTTFYRSYPDAVRGLVLSDTRTSADTEEGRARRFASAEKAKREGASAIAAEMIPLLLGRTSLEKRPDVVNRVRLMAESNPPRGIAAAQRAMADRLDSGSLLASVTFPVLLICGAEDTLSTPAEMEAMCRGIPGSNLKVIENAGHLPNIEQPDRFNEALLEYINSLQRIPG